MMETPHYAHAPIAMKRVATPNDVDAVGEFAWGNENGIRHIMIALPRPRPDNPNNYLLNYLPVVVGRNIPSKGWGWDGNEDAPTLNPSIHSIGHWHGWVRDGTLIEA